MTSSSTQAVESLSTKELKHSSTFWQQQHNEIKHVLSVRVKSLKLNEAELLMMRIVRIIGAVSIAQNLMAPSARVDD
jgi:hypothetical protein